MPYTSKKQHMNTTESVTIVTTESFVIRKLSDYQIKAENNFSKSEV